jgi:3D (Asp-Asp-Asp) domain-containing protein
MMTKRELLLILVLLVFAAAVLHLANNEHKRVIADHREQVRALQTEIKDLKTSVENLMAAVEPVDFEIQRWTATAYAPLDPDAVEGVCYSGDPNITASGREIRPGITVAAGPSIPFGTWIWIEGFGWRCVEDRGSAIRDGRVDIAMISRQDALDFGRQEVLVIIPKGE